MSGPSTDSGVQKGHTDNCCGHRRCNECSHALPPRHLEPLLQALVRDGILRGIRGPHGGYELGRERNRITADDILRAATTADDVDALQPSSPLVNEIVWPALAETERTVSVALGRISIDDMVRRTTVAK